MAVNLIGLLQQADPALQGGQQPYVPGLSLFEQPMILLPVLAVIILIVQAVGKSVVAILAALADSIPKLLSASLEERQARVAGYKHDRELTEKYNAIIDGKDKRYTELSERFDTFEDKYRNYREESDEKIATMSTQITTISDDNTAKQNQIVLLTEGKTRAETRAETRATFAEAAAESERKRASDEEARRIAAEGASLLKDGEIAALREQIAVLLKQLSLASSPATETTTTVEITTTAAPEPTPTLLDGSTVVDGASE